MTDTLTKYWTLDRWPTKDELKAAYMVACNALEGAAFRETVCARSKRHARLFWSALTVEASKMSKGKFRAWMDSLGPIPYKAGTDLMRDLIADSNRRAVEYARQRLLDLPTGQFGDGQ